MLIAAVEIGAQGSRAAVAAAIAVEVARLAVIDVTASDDDLGAKLELATAHLEQPALTCLATDPEIDTASIVVREAVRRFEARGCRHLGPSEWSCADASLRDAVATRLSGRYRRALK